MSFDFRPRLEVPSPSAAARMRDIATVHTLAVDGLPGPCHRRPAAWVRETGRRMLARSAQERPRKSAQALPSGA